MGDKNIFSGVIQFGKSKNTKSYLIIT